MKVLYLQNPVDWIKSAQISDLSEPGQDERIALTVQTVNGRRDGIYHSVRGAKVSFSYHFMRGAIWKEGR